MGLLAIVLLGHARRALESPSTKIGLFPTRNLLSLFNIGKTHLTLINNMRSRTLSTGSDSHDDQSTASAPKKSKSSSRVHKFQKLVNSNSIAGWEQSWEKGLTPWDLGQPTPVLVHLHQNGALPNGRALVPGCGTGYDVLAIACPERHVVGLEISDMAIKKAIELSSISPNADYAAFIKADFFTWHPTTLFDLIYDYTFFCAIEPHMRAAWARQVQELLKPDGELITLIFSTSKEDGGPPYRVAVQDYEEVLHPVGLKAISIVENELAVAPRTGREKLARWKRFIGPCLL